MLNRRELVLKTLEAGAYATVTAAVAYPLVKTFALTNISDADKEGVEIDLNQEKLDDAAVAKLMEQYEIPTVEAGQKLYKAMSLDKAAYCAAGAVMGSLFRSTNNAVSPLSKRNLFQRATNILAGGALAQLTYRPFNAVQDSPLTKPNTLVKEYGLSPSKAELFCENYKKALASNMQSGGAVTAAVQDIVESVYGFDQKPAPKPSV